MAIVTRDIIRAFILDNSDNIELLEELEFKDGDIDNALDICLAKLNAMTPITDYKADDLHDIFKYPLICGTAAILMKGRATAQLRNQISFQDMGRPVGIHDKYPQYAQLAADLRQEFEMISSQIKQQLNMESGFDSVGTEYFYAEYARYEY